MPPAEARLKEVPSDMTEAEWSQRINLAACYRLIAHYGWDDLVDTHISARVPGPEHHFLINPYGLMFDEITASSLVKVDLDGNQLTKSDYSINPAGFTIHSAIHANREDAHYVMRRATHARWRAIAKPWKTGSPRFSTAATARPSAATTLDEVEDVGERPALAAHRGHMLHGLQADVTDGAQGIEHL